VRAEDELTREMAEALRRSVGPSAEPWLEQDSADAPAQEEEPTFELSAADALAEGVDEGAAHATPHGESAAAARAEAWTVSATGEAPEAAPSRGAAAGGEDDLWRIVRFDDATQDGIHNSFDEAIARADASLEQLVGVPGGTPPPPAAEPTATLDLSLEDALPGPLLLGRGLEGDNDGASGDDLEGVDDLGELAEWDGDDDVEGDPSDPAEAARRRRQRLLRRAMENLGALTPRPAPAEGGVEVPPPSASPEGAGGPPPSSGAPGSEEARFAEQLERRFAELQKGPREHFRILGVPREASRDQVKAAFLGLAKVFHPDRLPQGLAHLQPKITTVFESVREAYDVLYDDARRAAYLATLVKAAPPVAGAPARAPGAASSDPATDEFQKGEVLLRKRDFAGAEAAYARAHALQPRGLYLAARAWVVYMDPSRRQELPQAKKLMVDALKAEPTCDRAHYQLGVVARVENDAAAAEKHFREAVRLNPKHLEANQELRLIEMRKKKGTLR
jgi:tetratricopeptide (TPR) repeat protein